MSCVGARALPIAALVAALVAPAAAERPPDAESRARAHYEVGLGMYHLGNYRDAIREFSAGYELSPRPQFLINLAQAYRKLRELDKAAAMFRRYLAATPANAPDRDQVVQLLGEVEREAAAGSAPTGSAPTGSAPTGSAPTGTAPTGSAVAAPATHESAAAPSPTVVDLRAAPRRPGALRRFWWTIPVGAVIVGAAVGLGIYFGTPPSQVPCGSASIGCVDARH